MDLYLTLRKNIVVKPAETFLYTNFRNLSILNSINLVFFFNIY